MYFYRVFVKHNRNLMQKKLHIPSSYFKGEESLFFEKNLHREIVVESSSKYQLAMLTLSHLYKSTEKSNKNF